jgi:hypothetical protein
MSFFFIPRAETLIPIAATFVVAETAKVAFKGVKSAYNYWFAPDPVEELARKALESFDACDTGIEAGLDMVATTARMGKSVRSRVRQIGANAVALHAYLKFGKRPKTDANVMITRKFVSDLLMDRTDLRLRDKVELMDRAVFLSFVPSNTILENAAMERSDAYAERVCGAKLIVK